MKPSFVLLLVGLVGLLATGGWSAISAAGTEVSVARYESGGVKARVVYVEGRREGEASYWYEDGSLMARGSYLHDRREGRWEWFREDGQLDEIRSGLYEAGRKTGS